MAADIAPDDPIVLTVLGIALTISREFLAAQIVIEKALALDPNSAWAWNRSTFLHTYLDEPYTGIDHFAKALRLSPLDPTTFMTYAGIGMAHFVAGRYLEAVQWDEKALLAHPKAIFINRLLAAAYTLSDKQAEAEASVRKLLVGYPDMTVRAVRAAFPLSAKVLERLCDGLTRAGYLSEPTFGSFPRPFGRAVSAKVSGSLFGAVTLRGSFRSRLDGSNALLTLLAKAHYFISKFGARLGVVPAQPSGNPLGGSSWLGGFGALLMVRFRADTLAF
nr:hypothetical protein [Microvirga ossetica]